LADKGIVAPTATKTGTTIVGMIFDGGVVLGADTRSTNGSVVADKNCEKIHYIAPNVFCCGAGTAADTENTTAMIASKLELERLHSGKESRCVAALTKLKQYLFGYQGYVSAALVLGGVDRTGPHLYTVHPHGSTDELPFVTMGSGSLAAMAVFEKGYKEGLTQAEAMQMVYEAISAGIFNDLGSGGNVDLCVITQGNVQHHRNYAKENERSYRNPRGYAFPKGSADVLSEQFLPISQVLVVEEVQGMDTE
jgi:20S proteasome subunit beta 2